MSCQGRKFHHQVFNKDIFSEQYVSLKHPFKESMESLNLVRNHKDCVTEKLHYQGFFKAPYECKFRFL